MAQRDKASESEDFKFESWQSPFFSVYIKKTFPLEPIVTKNMFRRPANILVVGSSGSGKTVFVSELLKEPHRYFRPVPKRLHYCYGAMQPLLQELRDGYKVGLHEGLPIGTHRLPIGSDTLVWERRWDIGIGRPDDRRW